MKISVIISTYNSPQWLEKVLWGYECQSETGFEIVIADDGSGEPTRQLIERFRAVPAFSLQHVHHHDDGFRKWEIVNKAIEAATGDYLVFTDGDCIPHKDLVKTHRENAQKGMFLSGGYCKLPLETSEIISRDDIVSGEIFTISWLRRNGYGFTAKWLKVLTPGRSFSGILNSLSPAARTFNGNNSSCFRADALNVRGFDERILYGGGDREFGYRLEHAGISPKIIRYSTICLHLDHPRGYKSKEVREKNLALIEETRTNKAVVTRYGIGARPN